MLYSKREESMRKVVGSVDGPCLCLKRVSQIKRGWCNSRRWWTISKDLISPGIRGDLGQGEGEGRLTAWATDGGGRETWCAGQDGDSSRRGSPRASRRGVTKPLNPTATDQPVLRFFRIARAVSNVGIVFQIAERNWKVALVRSDAGGLPRLCRIG